MAQESSNLFFNELLKSKPTPENRAAWLANHKKLIELEAGFNNAKVRPSGVSQKVRRDLLQKNSAVSAMRRDQSQAHAGKTHEDEKV